MDQDIISMEKRIQAFYKQSGGPHNPQIQRILEKHLLYGKDHGMAGYKETYEDAVMDTIINDPSLLLLYERIQRWRLQRRNNRDQSLSLLESKINELKREIEQLKAALNSNNQ